MSRLNLILACLLALAAESAISQSFPSKPITIICPIGLGTTPDTHMRGFANIAAKYLGQQVLVQNRPGAIGTLGPATMAASEKPDGYTLSQFPIIAFRLPHMTKVTWDPLKDFTYVIGISALTYGIVVSSNSNFKTLRDLIDYAKANPGRLRYGAFDQGGTPHLTMEDLGVKSGVRFLRVAPGTIANSAKLLGEGQILSLISGTDWGPYVDSGTFRLLVTFGERRTRWNAPTARELGYDILSYSPFGIVGPKGMYPQVTKLLHDAFNRALDDPEYDKLLKRLDMVDWYKSSEDYAEWAVNQFKFQRALIERTIGLGRN